MSSNGRCFDIGMTVAAASDSFLLDGDSYAGSPDTRTAGNGALMRLAPVPMYFRDSVEAVVKFAGESTRTTHGAREAIECSMVFGLQVRAALLGRSKDEVLAAGLCENLSTTVEAIALGGYRRKSQDEVRGSGYCVHALEAALWCFAMTETFEAAVLGAPKVDFSQFTLVGVSRGKQSHGCTSLNIKFVIRRGKRIDVHFTDPENARRTYGAMTVCPAVVTYLNDWVLIPRTPRHSVIRFVDSQSMR